MLGIVSLGSPGWLAARVLSRGGTFFKRFLPGICIFNASAVCVLKPHALCRRGGEVRCIAAQATHCNSVAFGKQRIRRVTKFSADKLFYGILFDDH